MHQVLVSPQRGALHSRKSASFAGASLHFQDDYFALVLVADDVRHLKASAFAGGSIDV
ncbi:MAG: hypothetical protein NTW52_08935 [Planctomycetota bacterium]|nr:hypothetical protein [Planctomycetota bacterium]